MFVFKQFIIQAVNFSFQVINAVLEDSNLLVLTFTHKLQIFNSVIILNTIEMVDYFSLVKAPAKMFSYNQAMFGYTPSFQSHWVKEGVN